MFVTCNRYGTTTIRHSPSEQCRPVHVRRGRPCGGPRKIDTVEPDSMPLFSMNPSEIKTGGLFMELGDLLFLVARLNDKP